MVRRDLFSGTKKAISLHELFLSLSSQTIAQLKQSAKDDIGMGFAVRRLKKISIDLAEMFPIDPYPAIKQKSTRDVGN
jgi:hypothetical protein